MTAVLYPNSYGTPQPTRTMEQILVGSSIHNIDPEFLRRILAMMAASDGRVGIGGAFRSTAQQLKIFTSRYHIVSFVTGIRYDGHYWAKNPGVAPSTPPGASYHEATTFPGYCLAADMVGDMNWMGLNAFRFGMHDFSDVNAEPWHIQPVEIPNARRNYNRFYHEPLPVFGLPGVFADPKPPVLVPPVAIPVPVVLPVLRSGVHSFLAGYVQQFLIDKAGQALTVDGWWGAKSAAAWNNLVLYTNATAGADRAVDGEVGGEDWSLIAWLAGTWEGLYGAGFPRP